MAPPDPETGSAGDRHLSEYETYDQHVDVVSALEWLFAGHDSQSLPATVAHFERFPRISVPGKPDPLTPDFTVLFTDGTAIVGEIAKLALHPNSADKLCRQIGGYATLDRVPDGRGGFTRVTHLDVMQLVHQEIVNTTVQKVILDRFQDPAHPYKPPRPPCIVGFSRTDRYYIFNRNQHPANGTLYRGARAPNVADFLDSDLKPPVERFARVKAARRFINDPVPPLYLATYLWTAVWQTTGAGTRTETLGVNPSATADLLKQQYGVGRVREVKAALDLLRLANLAAPRPDGQWDVRYRLLGRTGNRDVHQLLAQRLDRPPPTVPSRRRRTTDTSPDQYVLF